MSHLVYQLNPIKVLRSATAQPSSKLRQEKMYFKYGKEGNKEDYFDVVAINGTYNVKWVTNAVKFGMCCENTFRIFGMKHHCRQCGIIVCTNCSKRTLKITALIETWTKLEGSRVCDRCFDTSSHLSTRLASTTSTLDELNSPFLVPSKPASDTEVSSDVKNLSEEKDTFVSKFKVKINKFPKNDFTYV